METSEIKLTESYFKRTRKDHPGVPRTIPDCLRKFADSIGDKEAVVFVNDDFSREPITWCELYTKSRAAARALVALGVKQKEVVALNVRNCPHWLFATFGAMMAGAIPVSISFTYKNGSDLVAVMERLAKCCLLVMDPGVDCANWNVVKELVDIQNENGDVSSAHMPYLRYLLSHERGDTTEMSGVLHLDTLLANDFTDTELPSISENDIAFLFQTSGSTGIPKLVAHSHRGICLTQQLGSAAIDVSKLRIFGDRPFAWIGGFPLTVISGITRVTLSGFSPPPVDKAAFLIEIAKREQCAVVSVLPQMIHEFLRRQDELTFDLQTMLSTGGQPLGKSIAHCIGRITHMLFIAYGGTEFQMASSHMCTRQDQFEPSLCGKPYGVMDLEIKIVDDSDNVVPVNTSGEILLRGDGVFEGYFNDPELTASVKTADGWYRTNDIGKFTENGLLYVYGRKSSVIISGGMKVSPEHIEHIIESFPEVESAIVVPIPDDAYYQVLCACVRVKPGSDVNEAKLRQLLEEYYNDKPGLFTVLPKHYLFLEEFPEVFTGKISRKMLETLVVQQFGLISA